MKGEDKERGELLGELARLRRRVADFEEREDERLRDEENSRSDENKCQIMFEDLPVSLWEEDVSQLLSALDELTSQGVVDFRAYVEEHPEFVQVAAAMIKVTDVNGATLRLYGTRDRGILLGPPTKVLAADSPEAFKEQLIAIAEEKTHFETEATICTLAGERIHVLVRSTIPSSRQKSRLLVTVLTDISELRASGEALRQSEELFRGVFEGAPDCIHIKDPSLRIIHANPALATAVGRPVAEVIGSTVEDLYGDEVGKHVREVDVRVLAGETVEEEHSRLVGGIPCTFHDIRFPLKAREGHIIGMCGISRNITERKQVSQAQQHATVDYPSEAMRATLFRARYVAATDSVVLLQGESGSGKDFLARYIHGHSKRSRGPFFAINCAALAHELAESELFGHEPGAFTGARGRKRGLLELAEGGTLLLNEIGELSLSLQSKLLTFLDTRSFTRVGGEKTVSVSARLIAATHRDLKEEVAARRFLSALYYRLDVFSIHVPPLRKRLEDVPVLVQEITTQLASDLHLTTIPPLDGNAVAALGRYSWPGNVRELRNVLERAMILPERGKTGLPLPADELNYEEWSYNLGFPSSASLYEIRDQVTKALCEEALRRADGNKKEAANLLGISRFSFYRYMKYYDIECDDETEA
jgi:PAS domain S-box-containing protein